MNQDKQVAEHRMTVAMPLIVLHLRHSRSRLGEMDFSMQRAGSPHLSFLPITCFLVFLKGAIIDHELKYLSQEGEFLFKAGQREDVGRALIRPISLPSSRESWKMWEREGLWVVEKKAWWDIHPQGWAGVRWGGARDAVLRTRLDEIHCS